MERKHGSDFFRSLMDTAPDVILVVDRDGTITDANKTARTLFGYTAEELEGMPVDKLVPVESRPGHAALIKSYFADPRPRPMGMGMPLKGVRKDGSLVPVEIALSPFSFNGVPHAIAIVRDVTEIRRIDRELREKNNELAQSNKELESFAYIASHDLQEPLRMIAGYTQLLERRYGDKLDDTAREYIGVVVGGVKRMQHLISDLLTFSRIATTKDPHMAVDLNDVIEQVLANLSVAIEEASASVKCEKLPTVTANQTQMAMLFQNLIGNAVKFRAPDKQPEITIRVTEGRSDENDSQWVFEVADNGIGIEPQYRKQIFEIFQRLHAQDEYAGTGIGLANCKKIVERHGGRIWVESAPQRGSIFSFTLPRSKVTETSR